MGLSRDDYTKFQKIYEQHKIFKNDPFAVLDQQGVGKLVEMATKLGKKARPDLEVGICGEHGGERRIGYRSRGWRRRRRRCRTTKRKPCGQRKVQTWVCGAASSQGRPFFYLLGGDGEVRDMEEGDSCVDFEIRHGASPRGPDSLARHHGPAAESTVDRCASWIFGEVAISGAQRLSHQQICNYQAALRERGKVDLSHPLLTCVRRVARSPWRDLYINGYTHHRGCRERFLRSVNRGAVERAGDHRT